MRSRAARRLFVVGSVVAAALLISAPLASAETETFATPGPTQFEVPAGVCSLTITVNGGQGGDTRSRLGGSGAQIQGTLAVTPGEILGINVAGAGGSPTELGPAPQPGGVGGVGGGGPGGTGNKPPDIGSNAAPGGGGGGASDVRQAAGGTGCVPCATPVPPSTPGSTLAERVIVAGGGGGAGFTSSVTLVGGAGGGMSGGIPNGDGSDALTIPGGAGGGVAGANGGAGGTGGAAAGTAGSANLGGTGGPSIDVGPPSSDTGAAGGGGGGGVMGGGGGASGDDNYGASGGGGSSFVAPHVTNVVNTPGGAPRSSTPADGSIVITYSATGIACPAAALSVSPRFAG